MVSSGSACCAEPRAVRYSDLGGIEAVLDDIRELVQYPLQHPEVKIVQYRGLTGCLENAMIVPRGHAAP